MRLGGTQQIEFICNTGTAKVLNQKKGEEGGLKVKIR